MIRASELSEENARLLREGKREEAEAVMASIAKELEGTRIIDELAQEALEKLDKAGIERPSEAFLLKLIGESGESHAVSEAGGTQGSGSTEFPEGEERPLVILGKEIKITGRGREGAIILSRGSEGDLITTTVFAQEYYAKEIEGGEFDLAAAKVRTGTAIGNIRISLLKHDIEVVNPVPRGQEAGYYLRLKQETEKPNSGEIHVDPKLTNAEVYVYAELLTQNESGLIEIGVKVSGDDEGQIAAIHDTLSDLPEVMEMDLEAIRASLEGKLVAFVSNKQEFFMAQGDNEDAQFLLSFLAPVTSPDKVAQFVGAIKTS